MIAWMSVPDFLNGFKVYETFFELKKENPEIFNPDIEIEAIFGCFPNAVWNGGGFSFGPCFTYTQMDKIRAFYNEKNIPLRLTFTNPALEEQDLYDNYCNVIASIFHNELNEVLVSTDLMFKYIKTNYPKFKIVRSIIGRSEGEPYLIHKDYKRTVLSRAENKNWELLDNIPLEDRDKIEILCHEICVPDCPYTFHHYLEHGVDQKCFSAMSAGCFNPNFIHRQNRKFYFKAIQDAPNHLNYEDFKEYMAKGYTHFKLSGRFDILKIAFEISNYFIKPEYQQDFVKLSLSNMIRDNLSGISVL